MRIMSTTSVGIVTVAASALFPAAASATVDLTAVRTRVADHPAYVRVVVDFTDGRLGDNQYEAEDPDPGDGRAAIVVTHRRVQAQAPTVHAHGLRVRITQATNRVHVRIAAADGRFKYLARSNLRNPERLVIDLYKSRPPGPAAEIPSAPDRCLALRSWTVERGRIRVSGSARFIFENQFRLLVRGADGRVLGTRHVSFGESGEWTRTIRYDVGRRQRGTLEAVDSSARDGALACLAQVGVTLLPSQPVP